jgi:uncharacterized protein with von Willebrand factor type A (vWA) domain
MNFSKFIHFGAIGNEETRKNIAEDVYANLVGALRATPQTQQTDNFADTIKSILDNETMHELYRKIEEMKKLQEVLPPFTNELGRLWDMSNGHWRNTNFDILKRYAELMQRDKSLQELAEMLGRMLLSRSLTIIGCMMLIEAADSRLSSATTIQAHRLSLRFRVRRRCRRACPFCPPTVLPRAYIC